MLDEPLCDDLHKTLSSENEQKSVFDLFLQKKNIIEYKINFRLAHEMLWQLQLKSSTQNFLISNILIKMFWKNDFAENYDKDVKQLWMTIIC